MIENYAKICDVIERLKKRKEMGIAYGLSSIDTHTFSEGEIMCMCHDKAPSGAHVQYVCSSFNCPANNPAQFSCNDNPGAGGMSEYSKCGKTGE